MDDYRASERTFQTLVQVAGRAGREQIPGRVIVQTYNPENYSILFAQQQEYLPFYETEINIRKQLNYPPFCDIIVMGITGEEETSVEKVANQLFSSLQKEIQIKSTEAWIYPPMRAPIDKIKNRFRWRIILKVKQIENIIDGINILLQGNTDNKVRVTVDVNPTSMI